LAGAANANPVETAISSAARDAPNFEKPFMTILLMEMLLGTSNRVWHFPNMVDVDATATGVFQFGQFDNLEPASSTGL